MSVHHERIEYFAQGRGDVFAALDGLNRAQKRLIDAGEYFLANQVNKAEWQVLVVAAELTDEFRARRNKAREDYSATSEDNETKDGER